MSSSSSKASKDPVFIEELGGFAIEPKTDCPHISEETCKTQLIVPKAKGILQTPCKECQDTTENWLCLTCGDVFCSRYVNEHMSEHNSTTKHPIALSFSDLSFWCYSCSSYVTSPSLKEVRNAIYTEKFPAASASTTTSGAEQSETAVEQLATQIGNLSIQKELTPEEKEREAGLKAVAAKLKSLDVKKVIVLTGAGISTASGIPDFRSPGTGLYDNLQKYDLPRPTAVFELDYFNKNPKPFFEIAKDFLTKGYKPTNAHHFIKLLHDNKLLARNYTQNIDALELKARIPSDVMVQAHGAYDNATCLGCKKKYPLSYVMTFLHDEQLRIPTCESCKAVVKPDIVFFGESLPSRFMQLMYQDFDDVDMLIVMGTSLTVYPVANLVDMLPKGKTRVLINRDRAGPFVTTTGPEIVPSTDETYEDYFIGGDIEESIRKLSALLGWGEELDKLFKEGGLTL